MTNSDLGSSTVLAPRGPAIGTVTGTREVESSDAAVPVSGGGVPPDDQHHEPTGGGGGDGDRHGRSRRWIPRGLLAGGLSAVLVAALSAHGNNPATPPAPLPAGQPTAAAALDPVAADIALQQRALRGNPENADAWALLALDYVEQAKVKVDPAYYPKAEGAAQRSLTLNGTSNVLGFAAEAALKAAQHDFTAARTWAQRGLAFDNANTVLWAALDDADTQLGRYEEAFAAAQRLNDLHPGVPAFTRAEYVYELRGDIPNAEAMMHRALDAAIAPSDIAFADYYLGELAWGRGDPAASLRFNQAGLVADPTYSPLLQGRARAEAALGQVDAAVRDYQQVVRDVPQPQYVIEAGEYLQSLGRTAAAKQMYRLFEVEAKLFTANGVTLDTDPTLFYADHGDPGRAVAAGELGIRIRPFIEMDDAYAWALHKAGRDPEALTWEHKALALGTQNALFFFHAGMIESSLGKHAAARADLTEALAINPHFNPIHAPEARAELARLAAEK